MDTETLQAVKDVTENVTTFFVLICWISWLIRENSMLKRILLGYLPDRKSNNDIETQTGI